MTERQATDVSPTSQQHDAPSQIDRRGFFRGAAALTVGGLGATAALAQATAAERPRGARRWGSASSKSRRPARCAGPGATRPIGCARARRRPQRRHRRRRPERPLDRVRPQAQRRRPRRRHRPSRAGPGRHLAHDRAHASAAHAEDAGRARSSATPRSASARGTRRLNGPAAFDALDRIPRLAWADYLDWFQQATGTKVRYGTRLVEIEPQGDVLRLHLESDGVRRVETTRKLVLANGYAGAGGPNVPDFVRALPAERVDAHDRPHSVRDAGRQGRRRHRRGLVGVRCGGRRARERRGRGASVQPPVVHRLSGAGAAGAAQRRRRRLRRPTAATRTCSSSPTSCPTSCAGETSCSAIAASRPCRSTRSSARSRSRASTSI